MCSLCGRTAKLSTGNGSNFSSALLTALADDGGDRKDLMEARLEPTRQVPKGHLSIQDQSESWFVFEIFLETHESMNRAVVEKVVARGLGN